MDNPFALIVLAAQKALLINKIPEIELAEQRLTIARALIKTKKYNNEQIRRFLFFLKTFIYIENKEINSKFELEVDILTRNRHAMGIIETIKMLAIEEATEQKELQFVTNLLVAKKFTITEIASYVDVDEAFVMEVKKDLNLD